MKRIPAKTVKVVLVLVFVVAAGGAGWYYIDGPGVDPEKRAEKELKQAEQTAQELNQSGDPKELNKAKDKLEGLAKNEQNDAKKLAYLKGAMDAAAAAGDYKSAYKLAKQVEDQEKTDISAATYAGYASMVEDYETAEKYFGIAAERTNDAQVKKDYTYEKNNAKSKANEN